MSDNHLPTNKIKAICKITDKFALNCNEINSLHERIVDHVNKHDKKIIIRWCAENGKLDIYNYFLGDEYLFQSKDSKVLILAAKCGNENMFLHILNKYRFKNDYHAHDILYTILYESVICNRLNIIKILVESNLKLSNNCINNAIRLTVSDGKVEIAEYLIKKNSPRGNRKILESGNIKEDITLIKLLFENCDNCYNKNELLMIYFNRGYRDVAEYLIEIGADVNYENDHILRENVLFKDTYMIERILDIYYEKNLPIPDDVITNKSNNINRLLAQNADPRQYHLFHPDIIKTLTGCKSARN